MPLDDDLPKRMEDEDAVVEDAEVADEEDQDEKEGDVSLCDASFHAAESVGTSGHDRISRCTEGVEHFLACVGDHQAGTHEFDFEDSLNILTSPELSALWLSLSQYLTSTDLGREVVEGVVLVASLTTPLPLLEEGEGPPLGLIQSLAFLNNMLPNLKTLEDHRLSDDICLLMEAWYAAKLPDRDSLVTNCLVTLIKRSLTEKGTKSEVRRVWALHQAVLGFRLTEDTKTRDLLVRTSGSSIYLTCQEGIRWLVFLMGLSPDMVVTLHREAKRCLGGQSKTACRGLGEVYLKAWEASGGEFRTKLELECIQDLMYRGLLAGRGKGGLAVSVLRVLQVLHQQKRSKQVQTMVSKLCEPFLWRHLKVANAVVRRNATDQFFSAYPVEDLSQTREERDNQLEMQHTLMHCLLRDEDPDVRCVAVDGVCTVLSMFWILIPAPTINSLVKVLLKESAVDSSSSKVRLSAMRGVERILTTCPSSHVYLKKVLPRLADCLHDPNEGVRAALLDLLLSVKTVRSIKFWDICSLEHLLARLETDKAFVCRRITRLLAKSYFPAGVEDDVLLERCIHMVQSNRAASRKFYQFIGDNVEVSCVVQLMLAVLASIKGYLKHQLDKEEKENLNTSTGKKKKKLFNRSTTEEDDSLSTSGIDSTLTEVSSEGSDNREEQQDDNQHEEEEEAVVEEHPYQDPLVLEGVLDIVCVLWMSRSSDLSLPENDQYRASLEKRAGKWLSVRFKYFKESPMCGTVVYLASFLPDKLVSPVASYCLARAKSGATDWKICVDSLCIWRRGETLLEQVVQGLQVEEVGGGRRRSRGVRFVETQTDEEQLATSVRLLEYLLGHPTNRTLVLAKCRDQLGEVLDLLAKVPRAIENRLAFTRPGTCEGETSRDLAKLVGLSGQIHLLLHGKTSALAKLEELLAWSEREVLSQLADHEREGRTRAKVDLCTKTLDSLGELLTSCLSLGLADLEFTGKLMDWTLELIEAGGEEQVGPVFSLMREAAGMAGGKEGEDWENMVGEGIPVCFAKVLSWVTNNGDKFAGGDGGEGRLGLGVERLLKTYKRISKGKGGEENLEDLVEVIVTASVTEMRREVGRVGLIDLPNTLGEVGRVAGVILQGVVGAKVGDYVAPALLNMMVSEEEKRGELLGALVELTSVLEVKGRRVLVDKLEQEVDREIEGKGEEEEKDEDEIALLRSIKQAMGEVRSRLTGVVPPVEAA